MPGGAHGRCQVEPHVRGQAEQVAEVEAEVDLSDVHPRVTVSVPTITRDMSRWKEHQGGEQE